MARDRKGDCKCIYFIPAVVSLPDATADDDITALALSYIEMENTPPTRAQYNSVMSELFKTSGECGDLRNELAALKAEKPSPDYTALIEQFESLAWLHHKDAKNSGSHWDLECRMCDIIKQMRATLEAVSAPAPVHPDHCGDASCTVCPTVAELGPVSNTLRERIEALVQECDLAYSEADHHNAYTHGFGKGMSAAGSRLRTLLSLLDKKEVK